MFKSLVAKNHIRLQHDEPSTQHARFITGFQISLEIAMTRSFAVFPGETTITKTELENMLQMAMGHFSALPEKQLYKFLQIQTTLSQKTRYIRQRNIYFPMVMTIIILTLIYLSFQAAQADL